MLKIINDLKPFFEDCYRRINVREYAKITDISPPTASKILDYYKTKNYLLKERYRNYILYYANNESKSFIDLSRIYWGYRLKNIVDLMVKKLTSPTIILFGSLSKAEAKHDSDVDLAIFAYRKDLNVHSFEKKLRRKIQIYWFKSLKDIKNKELVNNIINGFILVGRLSL